MPSPQTGKEAPTEAMIASLFKAGLELGVGEAGRKVSEHATRVGKAFKDAAGTGLVWSGSLTREMGKVLREDPDSVTHIVKEVWSRGGPKEKRVAAEALGRGLGRVIPHKAITAARDLARMARTPKEADLVGLHVLGPIMEKNPALVDRVKAFLNENEEYVQRAALAALVSLAMRKKKYTGLVLQGLLILAEHKEAEIRKAVKAGLKELGATDPAAAARVMAEWVRSEPTKERVAVARQFMRTAPATAKAKLEALVFSRLDKLANGADGASGRSSKTSATTRKRGARGGR